MKAGDFQGSSTKPVTAKGNKKRVEGFETEKGKYKERETKCVLSGNRQNFSRSALIRATKEKRRQSKAARPQGI